MDKSIYRKEYRDLIALLIEARKNNNLKQSDVAKKLKISQQDVSKYENLIRRLDIIEFLEICSVLNIDYQKELAKIKF